MIIKNWKLFRNSLQLGIMVQSAMRLRVKSIVESSVGSLLMLGIISPIAPKLSARLPVSWLIIIAFPTGGQYNTQLVSFIL